MEDRWSFDFARFKKISCFVAATTLRKFCDEDAVKVDHHPQKYVNDTSNQNHIINELVIFRSILSFSTTVKIRKIIALVNDQRMFLGLN